MGGDELASPASPVVTAVASLASGGYATYRLTVSLSEGAQNV
eukprot:COSAG06_NODE_20935_length_775_cov_6.295858_2_plen_41_part_01